MARPNNPFAAVSKSKQPQLSEKMREFAKRKASTGVDWSAVSALSLRCALHAGLSAETAVMFSQAAGGLGVCITIFQDGQKHKEYAMTAEEVTGILDTIAEVFGSDAEDLTAALANGVA